MAQIDENIEDAFEGCSGAYRMAKIDDNLDDAFEGCSGAYKMVRIDEDIEDSFKSHHEEYKMAEEDMEDTSRSCSAAYEMTEIEESAEDIFENGDRAYKMVRIEEDIKDSFKSHNEAYKMAGIGSNFENTSEFDMLLIASDEEEIGTSDDETVRGLVRNVELKSDEDESDSESVSSWSSDFSPHDPWTFYGDSGPHGAIYNCERPVDFYTLFLNDEILRLIVDETNRYGNQQNKEFQDTSKDEMKKFVGLCLQMGLVQMPYLENYWSSRPAFGGQSFAGKIMTRNRFEELLKHLHLADNDKFDGNRLHKIEKFVDLFNKAAVKWYSLGKELCINQSLILLQEKIASGQCMPFEDTQEYVIKLLKLCDKGGYTGRIKIYAGKDPPREAAVAEEVVLKLVEGYLDEGRVLCTCNFYSSIGLAEKLIVRKTHLIGTLKRNGKGIPIELKDTKLKKGQLCYKQKRNGVLVLKWRDKKDLYMISTKHEGMEMFQKPNAVEMYNEMKAFVSQSNHMLAYAPFVRKSTKWYKRIFFHLITNTAMTNAWKLYKDVMGNVRLNDFKMDVIDSLLYDEFRCTPRHLNHLRHELEELPGSKTDKRRRCSGCYAKLAKEQGRAMAMKRTKMVNTRCNRCDKYFCLKCFNKKHNM